MTALVVAEVQSVTRQSTDSILCCNGKLQSWNQVYSLNKAHLAGVTESKGQMLLVDGTGGSGTVVVPNAVTLPPKSKENNELKSVHCRDDARCCRTSLLVASIVDAIVVLIVLLGFLSITRQSEATS